METLDKNTTFKMKRIAELCELRFNGLTYQEIGDKFGISRQRIHQLLSLYKKAKSYKKNLKILSQRRMFQIKLQVLTHYGNGSLACIKCGYNDVRALSIDHIDGRKSAGHRHGWGGIALYQWLIRQDYPEGYQTLCMNCQWIKRFTDDRKGKIGRPRKNRKHKTIKAENMFPRSYLVTNLGT